MFIRQIDYKTAMTIIVDKHYLRRKCPCSIAFGLFADDKLAGVITFGKPSSYTLCNGICGKDESKNVIEFNRLWVDDSLPHNTESWFIARALKKCPYEIIVSFADTEQGHVGYVYQATNWLYCGVSPRQKYFRLKEAENDNSGGTKYRRRARMAKRDIIEMYGESMVEEYYSSNKYRYIFFNCDRRRRRELKNKLRYEVLPYPKAVNHAILN